MESLMQILAIPALLLIIAIVLWILKIWIIDGWLGGLKFEEFKEQNWSIKDIIFWIMFVILFNLVSRTICLTFTNIAILLCGCAVVILIMKYITPMLYTKTTLFAKKHSKDIFALLFCLLLFALIGALNGKIQ